MCLYHLPLKINYSRDKTPTALHFVGIIQKADSRNGAEDCSNKFYQSFLTVQDHDHYVHLQHAASATGAQLSARLAVT